MLELALSFRRIGLTLEAVRGSFAALCPAARAAVRDGVLYLDMHPAASPVELRAAQGAVQLAAVTGTAGPGYHASLVALADAVASSVGAELSFQSDPARYAVTRDRVALEQCHADWLGGVCREILELADAGAEGFALALPSDVSFAHDGFVATSRGPRDRAWVERVAADPAAGRDAFAAWADEGSAEGLLGRAEVLLWCDVRWRKPLDDDEREGLLEVASLLERAHGLDPERAYPWVAWSELFAHLGEESLRATRAQMRALAQPPGSVVGYRRLAVRVELSGGWSIAIPGSLRERWDDRGTWTARDAERAVWITTAEAPEGTSSDDALAGLPELEGSGAALTMERGPIRGLVRFGEQMDGDTTLLVLRAHAALGAHVVMGTFIARDASQRATLLEVWGSLDHPDAAG